MKKKFFLFIIVFALCMCMCGCGCKHENMEWMIDKQASCLSDGLRYLICKTCGGRLMTEVIPATGHTIVIDKPIAATCETDGKTEGQHCSVCNEIIFRQSDVVSLGHKETLLPFVAASCEENGLSEGKFCSVCDKTLVEQVVIPATGHTIVIDKPIAATCETDGKTEGKHCSVCNEILVEQVVIPATGHTIVIDKPIAATCETDGKTEGKHCSVCNEILVEQVVIPATGHTIVIDKPIAATCETDGKTEGKHCSVCNEILVEQVVIPATGHSFNEVVEKTATCSQNGIITSYCKECSYKVSKEYSMTKYSATEIYEMNKNSVAVITTYDKSKNGLSLGTGFVYSEDGEIVTNYHVIEDARYIVVELGGVEYNVSGVVAYDSNIDLEILKINANNLEPVKVCNLQHAVGGSVYALGNSKGLTNTFSQGIITSAKREMDGITYIQHDAAISSGNSGGPLINEYGEVIGINTFTVKDAQNLNFAITINEVNNLSCKTYLSMAEIYEKEFDVFQRVKRDIIKNGTLSNNQSEYIYSVYADSEFNIFMAYDCEKDIITLYCLTSYMSVGVLLNQLNGVYEWASVSNNYSSYYMKGTINATTYTTDSILYYSTNTYPYSLRDSARDLSKSIIDLGLICISADYLRIGISIEDFGFTSFYN